MRVLETFQGYPCAAVYVLQRHDRSRFKVGWSTAPLRRIRLLPEFGAGQIDLSASAVLWLPSRTRAKQIESVAHKTLAPYAAEVDHRGDGHSEWFEPVAHPMAVRLLTQVPLDERTDRRARLTPIRMKASPENAVSIETGPQHCWWALEDLWSRLAMHCRVTVECEDDVHTLVIEGFRQPWAREQPVAELRTVLMDMSTYAWNGAGRRDDFIKLIDYRGDDLICQFASLRLIETWPDGPDLVWQVRGFLLRLHRLAIPGRGRAGGGDAPRAHSC